MDQTDRARRVFESAAGTARETGECKLETLALQEVAAAQERVGDVAAAARSRQRALSLQASSSEDDSADDAAD